MIFKRKPVKMLKIKGLKPRYIKEDLDDDVMQVEIVIRAQDGYMRSSCIASKELWSTKEGQESIKEQLKSVLRRKILP